MAFRGAGYVEDLSLETARQRILDLQRAGKRVVIVLSPPGTEAEWPVRVPGVGAPACIDEFQDDNACSWVPPTSDWVAELAAELVVPVIDLREMVCDAEKICHAIVGGTVVYFDDNHLTNAFARSLTPWLVEELSAKIG